jgi:hypothetical protein
LREALTRFYPPDEAIGIRNAGGDYNQLSTSLLQIENEFYGTRNDPWLCYSEYMLEREVPALLSTPSRACSPGVFPAHRPACAVPVDSGSRTRRTSLLTPAQPRAIAEIQAKFYMGSLI